MPPPFTIMDKRLDKDINKYNQVNGKGDSYRIPVTDKQYQENYNKIFKKETNVSDK